MTVRGKRNYDITALQRGLRLLHLFSEFPRGLTAKQVAGLSRLPVSTVHRFLANLVSAGFLNRDGEGTHHLGIACFSIGQAAVGQLDIRRLSLPTHLWLVVSVTPWEISFDCLVISWTIFSVVSQKGSVVSV